LTSLRSGVLHELVGSVDVEGVLFYCLTVVGDRCVPAFFRMFLVVVFASDLFVLLVEQLDDVGVTVFVEDPGITRCRGRLVR